MTVDLPSYWGPMEPGEYIEEANDDLGAFRDDLERDLRESGDEFSLDSPRSGLGKGVGLELLIEDEGIDTVLRTGFYPLRTGWLAFKLTAPQQVFDAAFAEFKKSRKTLELVD